MFRIRLIHIIISILKYQCFRKVKIFYRIVISTTNYSFVTDINVSKIPMECDRISNSSMWCTFTVAKKIPDSLRPVPLNHPVNLIMNWQPFKAIEPTKQRETVEVAPREGSQLIVLDRSGHSTTSSNNNDSNNMQSWVNMTRSNSRLDCLVRAVLCVYHTHTLW